MDYLLLLRRSREISISACEPVCHMEPHDKIFRKNHVISARALAAKRAGDFIRPETVSDLTLNQQQQQLSQNNNARHANSTSKQLDKNRSLNNKNPRLVTLAASASGRHRHPASRIADQHHPPRPLPRRGNPHVRAPRHLDLQHHAQERDISRPTGMARRPLARRPRARRPLLQHRHHRRLLQEARPPLRQAA